MRKLHTEEGVSEKGARTDKSDTGDTCTEAGGEAGTAQSHSRHKKQHTTNIFLTDSDEEAVVDFVKDPKKSLQLKSLKVNKKPKNILPVSMNENFLCENALLLTAGEETVKQKHLSKDTGPYPSNILIIKIRVF